MKRRSTPTARRTETAGKKRKSLFSSAETVLVGKDLRTIWGRGDLRGLLMILPVVLVVILPIVGYVAISLLPDPGQPSVKLLAALGRDSSSESLGSSRQMWMSAFTTLICPVLYLCVPILCAVGAAAGAFAGEKEGRTLETLFLSSMNAKAIFNAKLTACVLLSVIISWVSFLVLSITLSILDLLLGAPYFFTLEWLMIALLLTPALALFSVVFVTLILRRIRGVGEALQTMGYLVLPILLLYLGQLTGAFRIHPLLLLILAVLLAVLAIVLFNVSARRFQAEQLDPRESA